jgi:signal-transduction protein with cAMP-binding, CBS, and nucleotidyltransferase domain
MVRETKSLLPKEEQAMAWKIESKIVRKVATIDESKSTLEAAILMTEEFIGAVVVKKSSDITGIFTERDLMMRVVGKKKDPEKVKIRDVMSNAPPKVSPKDTTSDCLDLMKNQRCRHLLVFADNEFVGIVSLRDLVALMIEEKEELIESLNRYITS